ncbi:uncharacterized protein [Pyrus communis]|uniref:uncharacterized protein isoform X2 n=1 Tax=Pyrus communis TaxID=23211 RepID=UPI0035C1F1D7
MRQLLAREQPLRWQVSHQLELCDSKDGASEDVFQTVSSIRKNYSSKLDQVICRFLMIYRAPGLSIVTTTHMDYSTYANFRAYRKAMFSIWGTKNQICYLCLQ